MSGKRKSVLILTGGTLLLLSLIFLPGPNGLVRVLLKLYRIKKHQAAILQLKNEADTLEQKIKLWQDPRYATHFFQFRHNATLRHDKIIAKSRETKPGVFRYKGAL